MPYKIWTYFNYGMFAYSVIQLLAYTLRNMPEYRLGAGIVLGLISLFILALGVLNAVGLSLEQKGSLGLGLAPSLILLGFMAIAIFAGMTI